MDPCLLVSAIPYSPARFSLAASEAPDERIDLFQELSLPIRHKTHFFACSAPSVGGVCCDPAILPVEKIDVVRT